MAQHDADWSASCVPIDHAAVQRGPGWPIIHFPGAAVGAGGGAASAGVPAAFFHLRGENRTPLYPVSAVATAAFPTLAADAIAEATNRIRSWRKRGRLKSVLRRCCAQCRAPGKTQGDYELFASLSNLPYHLNLVATRVADQAKLR